MDEADEKSGQPSSRPGNATPTPDARDDHITKVVSQSASSAAYNGVSEYFFRDYHDLESRLAFYVIHLANRIIYDHGAWRAESGDCFPPFPTTIDGFFKDRFISPGDFLSAAELIAGNVDKIPNQVMLTLKKIIDMRERTQEVYIDSLRKNLLASGKRVKTYVRSAQKPHWHLISYMKQVWHTWDGDAWLAAHEEKYGRDDELARQQADERMLAGDETFLAVRFVPDKESLFEDKAQKDDTRPSTQARGNATDDNTRLQKRLKVIWQIDYHRLVSLAQQSMDDFTIQLPPEFESQSDYHMALICLLQQANETCAALRETWCLVAQGKLPLAVAGFLAHVAIATVWYHEEALNKIVGAGLTFHKVIIAVVQGSEEAPLAERFISPPGRSFLTKDILFRETFQILVDFIADYRVNRSGVPTDEMQATFVEPWDPDADLQSMTDSQRSAWLRTYTIKWLYDFMSFYLLGYREYLQEAKNGAMPDEELLRCNIDGHAADKRRLIGLDELANELTQLILDRNTHPRDCILFRQVFHMHCLIDSFLVTRGWHRQLGQEHVFEASTHYNPLKGIESFFAWSKPNGFGPSFADARCFLYDEVNRHQPDEDQLSRDSLALCQQVVPFFNIVGNTCWRPSAGMPSCSFADPDGVYKYSPLLSGSALAQALTLGSTVGSLILDRHTEVVGYAHVQNMLLHSGHMKKPTKLYEVLCTIFGSDLFPDGVPTSDFGVVFYLVLQGIPALQGEDCYVNAMRTISDVDHKIGWDDGNIYNLHQWAQTDLLQPSLYQSFSNADHIIDGVPNAALPVFSYLSIFKLVMRSLSGDKPRVHPGEIDISPQALKLLRGFYTVENADKKPADIPYASTRPDVGNLIYKVRCDALSEAATSSYLNYPRIVTDVIRFFEEFHADSKEEHGPGGKKADDEKDKEVDNAVRPIRLITRGSRLLAASQILCSLDEGKKGKAEETERLLARVARVMERTSRENIEDYFYHGFDPGTLERVVEENSLIEKRYSPECTMQ